MLFPSIITRPIPDPCRTEGEFARFHHHDIAGLSASQLWAEIHVLQRWLAHHLFYAARPRLVDPLKGVTDRGWVRGRVRRLRAALKGTA